jgi:sec-independent protein translocase protein TatB
MFDIGFWELGLIGVVALVVIGPERLPAVARTVGRWVGSAQRLVSTVKADIDAEINKQEELKQLIEEQKELKETHEILEQTVGDLREPSSIPSNSASSSKAVTSKTTSTSSTASTAADTARAKSEN